MQSLYTYEDYRKYLKDYYRFQKQKNPLYSYKLFSKSAGIVSPNYLALVMDGSRNLTTANIQQFSRALQLRPDEINYFEALVLHNQSKTAAEQTYYKARILSLKKNKPVKIQKSSPGEVLKEWYSTGIMVLSHGRDFDSAIKKCKSELLIPIDLIEKGLQNLIEMGFLIVKQGKLEISSQQITFHDPKSISQFQEAYLLSQIENSLRSFRHNYKLKKGKFLSHTLTVPKNSIDELQKEFVSLVEDLTQKMDDKIVFDEEELCQINIQIFRPHLKV